MIGPGATIAGYIVERELGVGSMGYVWRVRDRESGEAFAMKYLPLPSAVQRERLRREGDAQALLAHDNVVRVVERLDVGGDPGIVLELVPGPRLDELLAQGRPPLSVALDLFRQLVHGVVHAHARGVIHRDLKPSNILLARAGRRWVPKIADFGIAKALEADEEDSLTSENVALGSPAYMSPEQATSARDVDPRTDLFALGCILYELVCGESAFGGAGVEGALKAAAERRFRSTRECAPDAPEWVHEAIVRCLEPSREARIASGKELLQLMGKDDNEADAEDTDLRDAPDQTVLYGDRAGAHAPTVLYGQSAGSAVPPEPTSMWGSRLVILVLALVALALIAAIVVVVGQGNAQAEGEYVPLEDVLGGE